MLVAALATLVTLVAPLNRVEVGAIAQRGKANPKDFESQAKKPGI